MINTKIKGMAMDLKAISITADIKIMDNMVTFLKSFEVVSCKSEYMAASPVTYQSP